jgi:NADH dehydrogenase
MAAHRELEKLGVTVRVATKVTSATEHGLQLGDEQLPAELMVWAAGIKAPDFLKDLAGLENNRLNQLLVKPTLQTTRDDQIYVIGDAAGFPLPDNKWVPPRAQSAHQMAEHLVKNLLAVLEGRPQTPYEYRDHGSLISLSRFGTVGSLMGNLVGGAMMIEGRIARMAYISLYRMHQVALHGWVRTLAISVIGRINKIIRPRLKLH